MSAPVASSSTSAAAPPPLPPPPPSDSSAAEASGPSSTGSPPSNAIAGPPGTASPSPLPSSSFPSSSLRLPPSQSISASATPSASRSAASPPTTATNNITADTSTTGAGDGAAAPTTAMTTGNMNLNPTLPSQQTQLQIAEARTALVASMSNMLDRELQSRASLLHTNAAALTKQERDVAKATDGLRRENDKLAKVARDAGKKIKELGNVQNWAEVLERDFLVLEETVRLVRDGDDDGSGSCSECSGSSYWSGSESEGAGGSRAGSRRGSVDGVGRMKKKNAAGAGDGRERDGDGDVAMNGTRDGEDASPVANRPGVNVSVDEAILASLSEAMATDIDMDLGTAPAARDPIPSSNYTEEAAMDADGNAHAAGQDKDMMEIDGHGNGRRSGQQAQEDPTACEPAAPSSREIAAEGRPDSVEAAGGKMELGTNESGQRNAPGQHSQDVNTSTAVVAGPETGAADESRGSAAAVD